MLLPNKVRLILETWRYFLNWNLTKSGIFYLPNNFAILLEGWMYHWCVVCKISNQLWKWMSKWDFARLESKKDLWWISCIAALAWSASCSMAPMWTVIASTQPAWSCHSLPSIMECTNCMLASSYAFGMVTPTAFLSSGFFYYQGLTLIPAWISNHTPSKVWDEITYPFLNFNGCTVEV